MHLVRFECHGPSPVATQAKNADVPSFPHMCVFNRGGRGPWPWLIFMGHMGICMTAARVAAQVAQQWAGGSGRAVGPGPAGRQAVAG